MHWVCNFPIPILQLQWLGIGIQWVTVQGARRLETACQKMKRHLQKPVVVQICPDHCLTSFRRQRHCSSFLVLLRLTLVYFAWVSTCPCSQVSWNSGTCSIPRLVEENRPTTSVHWKKMKKWMSNGEWIVVQRYTCYDFFLHDDHLCGCVTLPSETHMFSWPMRNQN